jgi:hypothetical protein
LGISDGKTEGSMASVTEHTLKGTK